jgi:hypothetical protein
MPVRFDAIFCPFLGKQSACIAYLCE